MPKSGGFTAWIDPRIPKVPTLPIKKKQKATNRIKPTKGTAPKTKIKSAMTTFGAEHAADERRLRGLAFLSRRHAEDEKRARVAHHNRGRELRDEGRRIWTDHHNWTMNHPDGIAQDFYAPDVQANRLAFEAAEATNKAAQADHDEAGVRHVMSVDREGWAVRDEETKQRKKVIKSAKFKRADDTMRQRMTKP